METKQIGLLTEYTLLSAITATTTSSAADIQGAKGVLIVFTEAGTVNNRSGVLTITISSDGTNFYAYNMLLSNAANTNSQTLTRVLSITRAAAGTDICWLTPETLAGISHIKATLTKTDGADPTGTFTVKAYVLK